MFYNNIRRGLWCVISERGKEGDRDLVYYSATTRYYAITMHFKRKVIVFSSSWRFLLNLSSTLYMHVLAKHVKDSMKIHGNLSKFSQQSFEKLNDRITSWYFNGTNHRDLEALTQIMNKQNRIELLEPTCHRDPKYRIKCSLCAETGHNKRMCPQREITE